MSNAKTTIQKRKRTGKRCIYYNESTGKYDVKFNYTTKNTTTGASSYHSCWKYNLPSLAEAEQALLVLKQAKTPLPNSVPCLADAYALWEKNAIVKNLSPVSIRNTQNTLKRIYPFVPMDTPLNEITEDNWCTLIAGARAAGYSEETIRDINATFRKLLSLAYKKRLTTENVLLFFEPLSTTKKNDYRLVEKSDYHLMDKILKDDHKPFYRLMFSFFYFTGLRTGELLALTFADVSEDYDIPFINVDKSYNSTLKIVKCTKNHKCRQIPLAKEPLRIYKEYKDRYGSDINPGDRIFPVTQSTTDHALKTLCKKAGLPAYRCHEFRHTFISYLIKQNVPLPVIERVSGDTQQTILNRYSHMFSRDEQLVLDVLNKLSYK